MVLEGEAWGQVSSIPSSQVPREFSYSIVCRCATLKPHMDTIPVLKALVKNISILRNFFT